MLVATYRLNMTKLASPASSVRVPKGLWDDHEDMYLERQLKLVQVSSAVPSGTRDGNGLTFGPTCHRHAGVLWSAGYL